VFTRNDALAADMRTLAARLDAHLVLNQSHAILAGKRFPIYRGELRFERSGHWNQKHTEEIVSIGKARCRVVYDLGVEDEPHLFALASGILTHNSKPNPMPESVKDRCTKAHEYIFLLAKSPRYYYDAAAVAEACESEPQTRDRSGEGYGAALGDGRERFSKGARTYGMDGTRNRRSVWTVTTKPYRGAHFATFPPDLIRPCIRAGCPPAGKRCDCDEIILSPTGSGEIEDPSMETGRAGMNRPRRENEGSRPITRREQRHEAEEMRASRHKAEMEAECGPAFAHYIRTDKSGARPLPESIRRKFQDRGWITQAPPCPHPIEPAGTVLDPFGGSGTTGEVAASEGRKAILIELNPEYVKLAKNRGGLFYTSNPSVLPPAAPAGREQRVVGGPND